jgi:hypothetical protein
VPLSLDLCKRADLVIYDEESDRHVHITFEDAMMATAYGADPGPDGDIFGLGKLKTDHPSAYDKFKSTKDKLPDGVLKTFATSGTVPPTGSASQRLTLARALVAAVKAGAWVPVEIVLARPFIEHLTLSAIVAVAGRDTGATLFGPADMQISANTSVKTIEGHYTHAQQRSLRMHHRIPAPHALLHGTSVFTPNCCTGVTPRPSSPSRRTCASCGTS